MPLEDILTHIKKCFMVYFVLKNWKMLNCTELYVECKNAARPRPLGWDKLARLVRSGSLDIPRVLPRPTLPTSHLSKKLTHMSDNTQYINWKGGGGVIGDVRKVKQDVVSKKFWLVPTPFIFHNFRLNDANGFLFSPQHNIMKRNISWCSGKNPTWWRHIIQRLLMGGGGKFS